MAENGFAGIYSVELLFDKKPDIKKYDLLLTMRQRCGQVNPLDGDAQSGLLSFVYPEHMISFADSKSIPAQSLIALTDTGVDMAKVEPSLQQSWGWSEAPAAVSRCRYTLLVTDFMASGLEYKERLALFYNVLLSVLDVTPCLAIHWVPSQQFVSPESYLASKQPGSFNPMLPAINVRLFNIEHRAIGETLMDTAGLAALGVPDLQCHFMRLDINDMARVLYNTAYYIFDRGDVIGDGKTIQGVLPEHRWRCQLKCRLSTQSVKLLTLTLVGHTPLETVERVVMRESE